VDGLPLPTGTLTAFVLVLVRTSAWVVAAPLFGLRGIAPVARLAMAVALAVFLTPLVPADTVPDDAAGFAVTAVVQALTGLALGWLAGLLLAAVEMAGALADLSSGLSYGAQVDPVNGAQSSAFGRLGTLMASALLFATDGAAIVVAGFVRSFDALPLSVTPELADGGPAVLGHALSGATLAAVEIAAPLLGVMFLTDVGLALVARFVPQANVLAVGISLKALAAFTALGTVLTLLPMQLENLHRPVERTIEGVLG
jgi:flagellar biosynthetic protein FliR